MTSDSIRQAADLLLAARNAQPIAGLGNDLLPPDLDAAYAVQDLVTAALGPIGAWKTAPSKDGVPYNWAPIPAAGIRANGATIGISELYHTGLELEVGLLVVRDLPPRSEPYRLDEVTAAIGGLRVCLELIGSRYLSSSIPDVTEKVADAQSAVGLIIGSGPDDWHDVDLGATELTLDHGDERYNGSGGPVLPQLLDAATLLANATWRLGGLKAGQVIITGARIGPVATGPGEVVGNIRPVGTVSASLT